MFGVAIPGCPGKGHLCKVARSGRDDPAYPSSARFHRRCRKKKTGLVIEPW